MREGTDPSPMLIHTMSGHGRAVSPLNPRAQRVLGFGGLITQSRKQKGGPDVESLPGMVH